MAALVLGGNISFFWKTILNADNIRCDNERDKVLFQTILCFSSSGGSLSGSGDTEVCAEPGSCDMELNLPIQDSPPYFNRAVIDSRPIVRDNNRITQVRSEQFVKKLGDH